MFFTYKKKVVRKPRPVKDRATQAKYKLLRKQAEEYFPYKVAFYAKKHGFKYERLRLMNAKTRWGSYSSRGTLSFNIALMRLPETLRDYVIIHELCHTKEMNHSKNFWALVASLDPHYKLHRQSLKTHTPYL